MSKSLKNFITIKVRPGSASCPCRHSFIHSFIYRPLPLIRRRSPSFIPAPSPLSPYHRLQEALQKFTSSQLRIMFLKYSWESVMDYKESVLAEAVTIENSIKVWGGGDGGGGTPYRHTDIMKNFCENVKAFQRQELLAAAQQSEKKKPGPPTHNFRDKEKDMLKVVNQTEAAVHAALCDNVNTPIVLRELLALITKANVYIADKGDAPNLMVLNRIAKYVTRMFKVGG